MMGQLRVVETEVRDRPAHHLERVGIEPKALINAPHEVQGGARPSSGDIERIALLIVRYVELGHRFLP